MGAESLVDCASVETFDYDSTFAKQLQLLNGQLDDCLRKDTYDVSENPAGLWEAMRYGTLNGGKRIRAILAIEACLACGGTLEAVLPTACGIELVHAQSLIHDDLPCMDNDDMRRGKPSVHKAFGESTAVLAGDALIALAFGVIAKQTPLSVVSSEIVLQVIRDFSDVTSVKGLVNGQYVDIAYEGKVFTPEILDYIHTYKTGALFQFALSAGARLAGASAPVIQRFQRIGQLVGLAFQIVDDLLDIGGTTEDLGKTAGKDLLQEKATYPALYGVSASRTHVEALMQEAFTLLTVGDGLPLRYDASSLKALVQFISCRVR